MRPLRRLGVWLKATALRFAGSTAGAWRWGAGLLRGEVNYAALVGDGTGNAIVVAVIRWVQRTFPEARVIVIQGATSATDGHEQAFPDHDLVHLVEHPNQFYSGVHLWSATLADLMVSGNAYWFKVRSGARRPTELWWIPSTLIEPRWPDSGDVFISHYDYWPDGRLQQLSVADVVHFRDGIDPQNIRKGLSPLASLARELFTDDEAATYTASLLQNLGVPGVIISPDQDTVMTQDDADRIKAEFANRYTGQGRGTAMVMSAKANTTVLSFSPQQMNLKDIRRIPEERVTAIYGVPAMVVGLGAGLDRSTYSNYEQAREVAYEGMVVPLQRLMAAELQTQLLDDFTDTRRFRVEFDNSRVRVLQEDQDKLFARLNATVWMTVNEKRAAVGLPTYEGAGDVFLVPLNIVTMRPESLGAAPPPADTTPQGRMRVLELPQRKQLAAPGTRERQLGMAISRLRAALQAKYTPEAIRFFTGQQRRVLARILRPGTRGALEVLTKDTIPPVDDLFPAGEEAQLRAWAEILYRDALNQTAGLVGQSFGADISFTDAQLAEYLQTCGQLITEITGTTRRLVQQALQEGIDAGEGVYAIRERIRDSTAWTPARAEMVARTELGRSMNQASLDSYRATGLVVGVQLLDGGMATSCAECTDRSGSILSLSDAQMANNYDPTTEGLLLHPHCTLVLIPLIDPSQMAPAA